MKITDVILKESEESDELVGEFLDYLDQKNYWEAFNSLIGAYDTDRDCLQSWWTSFDDMKPEIMKGLLTAIKNESDLPLESIIADMYADLKWPELVIVQKALMYNKQQKAVGEAYDPDADPVIGYVQDMYQDLSRGHTDLIVLSLRDYIYDTGSPENLARAIQEIKPELVDLIQKNKHDIIKSMLGMVKKDYEHASNLLFPVFKVLGQLGIHWPELDRIADALSHGTKNKQASESELTETLKTDGYGGWISPAGKVDYVGDHEHEEWMAANVGIGYDEAFEQNWVRFATQDTNDLYLQGKLSALKKVYSRYAGNIARTQSIFVDIVEPASLGPQYRASWDAFHFWSNPKDKNRFMKMFSPEPAQAAMAESQTEQIPAAEILKYVKQIHPEGEFNIDYVITDHPFWTEADVPVSSLHIFDPEKDDIYDPYNRVQDTDLYHVDRLIPNIAAILQNKPLVIDDAGYILDGNHRALAAQKAGLQTVPVYKPVEKVSEVKQRLDAKCWTGKHKEGTKIKGGVRVNNCVPNESVSETWSKKYKRSIDCSHPKGFSQKAHCAGRKKHNESVAEDLAVTDAPRVPAYIQSMEKKLSNNLRNLFQFVIDLAYEDRMSDPGFRSQVLAVFEKKKPELVKYMLHNIKHSDSDNVKWLAPAMIRMGLDWPELQTINQALSVKRPDRAVSEAVNMAPQALRTRMNKLMNDDQKYTDPTQRTNWQDGVWRFINSNQAAIFADKGNTGNGDYPAAPYAAWLLVQHMDAHPERQSQFYMKLRQAFPDHPKLQFLKDRAAVNAWIQKNANNPEYYYKGKPLPDPTVNVRNPAMFKDAAVKAKSREEALKNAEQAGNKLLVAAVKATNAQTQPSYTQQTESVEEADNQGKFKIISDMISRDYAEHPVRGFYMMLYHLNELELSVADMPEIKPLIDRVKPDVIRALLQSVKADNDGMNISNALQILDRMQNCGVDWPEIDKIRQGLQHNRQQTTEGIDEIQSDRLKSFVKQIQQPLASKTGWLAAQTLEDLAGVAISKSYSDNRFTDQDYAEAAAVLNLNNHKDMLIKGILENIKQNIKNGNSTTWMAENLAMQKQILIKLGCNWPEMDRIAAAVAHNVN